MHVFCSNVMHNIFYFFCFCCSKCGFSSPEHRKFSLQNNHKIALKFNSLCKDTQKPTFIKSYWQKKITFDRTFTRCSITIQFLLTSWSKRQRDRMMKNHLISTSYTLFYAYSLQRLHHNWTIRCVRRFSPSYVAESHTAMCDACSSHTSSAQKQHMLEMAKRSNEFFPDAIIILMRRCGKEKQHK